MCWMWGDGRRGEHNSCAMCLEMPMLLGMWMETMKVWLPSSRGWPLLGITKFLQRLVRRRLTKVGKMRLKSGDSLPTETEAGLSGCPVPIRKSWKSLWNISTPIQEWLFFLPRISVFRRRKRMYNTTLTPYCKCQTGRHVHHGLYYRI